MRLKNAQLVLVAIFCSILLGITLLALHNEYDRPWKTYQKEFIRLNYGAFNQSAYSEKTVRIQQLWLPELGITDRCITCHRGINNPALYYAHQPFRSHPGDYLTQHPVERYGCVLCHDGQGEALAVDAAHGEVKNWTKPVLKKPYAQSSCGRCHVMGQDLPLGSELSGGEVFSQGWRLFIERNCLGCHKLSGYKRPDRIAPSLSLIGSKVQEDWLLKWLRNPEDYLPETRMPRYRLRDVEISYIAAYLLSLDNGSRRNTLQRASALVKDGEQLVDSLGCLGCHRIGNKGVTFGPAFSNIGNKVKPAWLYQFLKNPKGYDPETIIPDFNLDERDISAIAAYLMSLKKDEIPRTSQHENNMSPEYVEKGRQLVQDLGCRGCHEIEKVPFQYDAPELNGIGDKRMEELFWGNVADVEKTLVNWLMIKVTDPGRFETDRVSTRMPDHNFTKDEAEALITFLLGIRKKSMPGKYKKIVFDPNSPEMRGKTLIETYNCTGCHKIKKNGGDISPELTTEAKKSRPEWLYNFLKIPDKIRPSFIMKARMPGFALTDREASDVIRYFAFLAEESYPFHVNIKKEIYSDDIRAGEKLYDEVFACIACHRMDGRGGEIGPEHTDLASRLKRDWIKQWLENPQNIKPDVRMPKFSFKDWEFEALMDYLMTRGSYRFVHPLHD